MFELAVEARGVKPSMGRRPPAAVPKHAPIPDAFEGRNFVVAGSAPSSEGEARICADRERQNVVRNPMIVGNFEAVCGCQFVIGVKRRRVTSWTALMLEDLLAACGRGVEPVRVGRRLEGVDVEGEGVELLIAVPSVDED